MGLTQAKRRWNGVELGETCLDYEEVLLLLHCASDSMYMGEGKKGGGFQKKQIMKEG